MVQNLDMSVKMNCINDKDYFKYGVIQIGILSPEQYEHDLFWDLVKKHVQNF